MKKLIAILLSVVSILSVCALPTYAASGEQHPDAATKNGRETVITITGEENIRKYLESVGEEYDPTLLCIQRRIIADTEVIENNQASPNTIIREYVIRNKKSSTYTDFSTVLKEYRRPSGRVLIDEEIGISSTYTADAGISAEILEANLGYAVEGTENFRIEWEETYSYAVRIKVYPIYEKVTGEIWDDDVYYDDYIGDFTVYHAVGDDVRVYRA